MFSRNAVVRYCSFSEKFGRVLKAQLPVNEGRKFHSTSPYTISEIRIDYLLMTVNLVAGSHYNTVRTRVCKIRDVLNPPIQLSPLASQIRVEVDPARLHPIDADLQTLNTGRFTAHTGWRPEFPFEGTITDLLDHWRRLVAERGNTFLNR